MTMRNRQFLVAAGLIVLAAWLFFNWMQSTASSPEPSSGPSPTGAIGSGTFTFAPSDSAGPSSTASATSPGASGGASPGGSGNSVATPAPGATELPPAAVRWTGTWTNTSPDTATGSLEIVWTQQGSALEGTVAMDGAACFTAGGMQGTIDGDTVAFEVVGRDQVAFDGTIAGDRASGTFTMSCDGSQGTWEASRQP
jgi:hypothetical protein